MSTPARSRGDSGAARSGDAEGRPTLDQVAARAGVSRATVSRVVNGSGSVGAPIVARVDAAIGELNYVPNPSARALMTRRTNVVSLVVTESNTRIFSDPFFAGIVRGACRELNRSGVNLVISMAQQPDEIDRLARFLRSRLMDGALIISEHRGFDVVAHTVEADIPLVMGGRPFDRRPDVAYVDNANEDGAARAARHLLHLGRRRLATIAGPQDMVAGVDRLTGYRAELGAGFDPRLVEFGDFTTAGGAEAADRLLARAPDVDGIFAASDLMAIGAMGRLTASGRSVPHDVAVVGFDDIALAEVALPPLTTVRQRTIDQGRLMAQLLLNGLGRAIPERMPELDRAAADGRAILDVELVIRESA